jgi:TolB-like protein/DNA-binding winged helix-turn-helix (wHTH) protein/Tfp pilus assembly protein PilF
MICHITDLSGLMMSGDIDHRRGRVLESKAGVSSGVTMKSSAWGRGVVFGAFELDTHAGELRKHGFRIKLQGQPLEVLKMLVERPGEVVTREELQRRLWSADTYVDFEHSLNSAIKRLRAALGDSADAPLYVETLARRGYRFVAPLTRPVEDVSEALHETVHQKPLAHRRWIFLALAMVVVFVAVLGTKFLGVRDLTGRAISRPIRSLAVLPLANLSGDAGQDYFVEGMTDALRQRLEGISSLRVISRTSSMHYQGSAESVPAIARELNVDAVIDGSVLRSGDRVRVSVELIRAGVDRHLWSNSYEGDLRDVFELQSNIARKIADEIRVTLTLPDRERLTQVRATNTDAYQAYSKGRFFWNKRTAQDLTKAIGFFEQAIDKDPGYALAYDGLADCWLPLGWYGYLSPSETFPHAKVAVTRALLLDASLAEAHTSLAFVHLYYDRDWTGAETEFRRAINLNPNYANGHHWYAEFLSLVGRHEQAISESQRARELDPLSNIINAWISSRYFFARQYDRAIEEGRNAVDMDPNFGPARLVLGQAYEQKGMLKEAIAEFEKARSLAGGSMNAASLAHALGLAGERPEALKVLEDLRRMGEKGFVSSYDLAVVSTVLEERDKTFELLTVAVHERSPRIAFLGVDPRFDGLRTDPRFKKLIGSLGL